MLFFLDENIPHQAAKALDILESSEGIHRVGHTACDFNQGITDIELYPLIVEQGGILITGDVKQKSRPQEVAIARELGLRLFILSFPSGANYWLKVKKVMDEWDFIKKTSMKRGSSRFTCRIKMRGEPEFLFEDAQ